MSFADVNLSEESIRGAPHNPGAGGWPTVRYFNKETGYEGASYVKKTDKAMCDELGDETYMQMLVEEAGSTSLCSIETGKGCGEKELSFIEKWKLKATESADKVTQELTRLKGMAEKSMADDLKSWVKKRIGIMKQFAADIQQEDAEPVNDEL